MADLPLPPPKQPVGSSTTEQTGCSRPSSRKCNCPDHFPHSRHDQRKLLLPLWTDCRLAILLCPPLTPIYGRTRSSSFLMFPIAGARSLRRRGRSGGQPWSARLRDLPQHPISIAASYVGVTRLSLLKNHDKDVQSVRQ